MPFVLEFRKIALENVILSLKIIKYTDSFPFFWIYAMPERKLCENPGFVEERGGHGAPIQFTGSPGIYQYHNENILVIEMKCDLLRNRRLRQKQ